MKSSVLHLFSFFSGVLALIYEVLWMRRFALLFGATAPAASATLAAFFLGMAVGSERIGRHAVRWSRPMRAFGLLQFGIAAGTLLVEPILKLYGLQYPSMYSLFTGFPAVFLTVKVVLAIAATFIPTFFMGGTLPVLAQALAADRGRLGIQAGGLYFVNTLGAAAGAISVPFAVLPWLGAERGYLTAVSGSALLGAMAWFLGKRAESTPRPLKSNSRKRRTGISCTKTAITLAFFSGLLLMSVEVLWTQMFALVHRNSVYSFSAVVATFLIGLAGGAFLAREFLRRGGPAYGGLVAAWCGAGLLICLSPRMFYAFSSGLDMLRTNVLLVSLPTMLPALLVSGAVLPLLMELAGAGEGIPAGPVLGRLLAANTAGSIAGPLIAGFVLSPRIGLWWSITVVGGSMVVAGVVATRILFARSWPASRAFAVLALAGMMVWWLAPGRLPPVRVNRERGERILSFEEGSYGAVAVLEDGDHRWMTLNNCYVLGGTSSARDESMQGHLPLFLHPAPKRVAFLGLGTGITAGAALIHPVESVVILELVPEVIRAARDYFGDSNRHVLEDPRVHVRAEDARNFLSGAGGKFDVIVGDLVVPWRPGESSLLSLESFRAARAALRPGGIYCQWLPLFQLSEEGFRIVAATFLQVYPDAVLWRGDFQADQPAVALVGRRDSRPIDVQGIDEPIRRLAPLAREDNPYLADPSGFWLHLIGALDHRNPFFRSARRNEDSHPWLELLTPAAQIDSSENSGFRSNSRLVSLLFEATRNSSVRGTFLNGLDAEHSRWRDAGADLWQASMLASEGKDDEARTMAFQTLGTLPATLRIALESHDLH